MKKEKKTKRIELRVTPSQYLKFKLKASIRHGGNISKFILSETLEGFVYGRKKRAKKTNK